MRIGFQSQVFKSSIVVQGRASFRSSDGQGGELDDRFPDTVSKLLPRVLLSELGADFPPHGMINERYEKKTEGGSAPSLPPPTKMKPRSAIPSVRDSSPSSDVDSY